MIENGTIFSMVPDDLCFSETETDPQHRQASGPAV
jgi:hypothetical protein